MLLLAKIEQHNIVSGFGTYLKFCVWKNVSYSSVSRIRDQRVPEEHH